MDSLWVNIIISRKCQKICFYFFINLTELNFFRFKFSSKIFVNFLKKEKAKEISFFWCNNIPPIEVFFCLNFVCFFLILVFKFNFLMKQFARCSSHRFTRLFLLSFTLAQCRNIGIFIFFTVVLLEVNFKRRSKNFSLKWAAPARVPILHIFSLFLFVPAHHFLLPSRLSIHKFLILLYFISCS